MDSLLRTSKFLDLKKSFSSSQNNRGNNSHVSYGLRSVSRNNNGKKLSVYSKFANRGSSEVTVHESNIPSSINGLASYIAPRKLNESGIQKAERFHTLVGNSRDHVENSFSIHYSTTSPVKNSQEINERSSYYKSQTQKKVPPSLNQVERDNDGFVIPRATVHRPKPLITELKEEDERLTETMLSELIDNLTPVEAFYYLKRYEEWLLLEKKKKTLDLLNDYHGLDRDKSIRIMDWLHSNGCEPHLGNRGKNREIIEDFVSVSSKNTIHHRLNPWLQHFNEPEPAHVAVFLLKNWTLIKGNGTLDLMVSGDLRDMKDQTLIEEGHVSSRVLSADSTIIKTSCCVYHLIGEFSDPNNNIPDDIKKHFVNSKFPAYWKEIVRKWNLFKQKESIRHCSVVVEDFKNRFGEPDSSVCNRKRKAPLDSQIEALKQAKVKKYQTEFTDNTLQTPVVRKVSNFSIVTRSALRKRQSRGDYSISGTPKSSKVYRLKSRIKTPMPRKRIESQVIFDDTSSF